MVLTQWPQVMSLTSKVIIAISSGVVLLTGILLTFPSL